MIAPHTVSASAAPFSGGDALAILAFMIDLVVGPLSLVILAVVAFARPFIALAWAQVSIALALIAVGTRPGWRAAVFGADQRDR